MLNVVCINAGNYQGRGVEYVNNLYRMVKANLSVPHRFICFTDRMMDDSSEGVRYDLGIYLRYLPDAFKGWWNKINLFKPGLFEQGDRVLYLDLSVVIMASIDDMAAFDGLFRMTQSFGAKGAFGGLQSNVMAWTPCFQTRHIYQSYLDAGCPTEYPGGDQAFIENHMDTAKTDTWADACPGKVVSFKWGLQGTYDGKASVVCFHGQPKPHEIGGWAYTAWSGVDEGEEVELIRPMKFIDVCNTEGAEIQENIKANAARDVPRIGLSFKHDGEAIIVGGGPSVAGYVADIKTGQMAGAKVFALNGAGRWLISQGIVPDYHVILDARPQNIDFLSYDREWSTVFLLASQCDPSLFRLLKRSNHNVTLWHVNDNDESMAHVKKTEPKAAFVSLGVTVGITVMNLIWTMGYRKADLYGYDSSSAGEDMHHAYPQPINDAALTDDYVFEGKAYRAQRALASQANHFLTLYQAWEHVGLDITVHGEGLLPDMWRAEERERENSKGTLEGEEAYKYRRCWQTQEYREYSPGIVLFDTMLRELNPFPGSRFIDFGCGTGRVTQKLADLGHEVLGIDHAANCLDPDVLIPLCVSNLWELPEGIEQGDYGTCTDVMEHIPEEKVDAVLAGIARNVKTAVFFNIAEHEVNFGHFLGVGALHVTQRKPEWWAEKLSAHFSKVEPIGGTLFTAYK